VGGDGTVSRSHRVVARRKNRRAGGGPERSIETAGSGYKQQADRLDLDRPSAGQPETAGNRSNHHSRRRRVRFSFRRSSASSRGRLRLTRWDSGRSSSTGPGSGVT
jgi:hypothetical protein